MALLELDGVSAATLSGRVERTVLDNVRLELDAGEVVGVLGQRMSGRTTLLRIAAGLTLPDAGQVRLDGEDLAGRRGRGRRSAIACWTPTFVEEHGREVYRQVAVPARDRLPGQRAFAAATRALERAGAEKCADLAIDELTHAERVRVALARALMLKPRVLILDEPTVGLDIRDARDFLALVGGISVEDDVAVLISATEASRVPAAGRLLLLSGGALRGETSLRPAHVRHLRAAPQEGSARSEPA